MAVIFVVLFGLVQLAGAAPAAALTLPAGFKLVDYATGQAAYKLTNFAWLEDGGLLTSGRDGTITFVPASGAPRVLTTVPSVRAVDDHGLLGLALANDYPTTGRVYVTYDKGDLAAGGFGMVEEWKAAPAASPTSFTRSLSVIDGSAMSPQLAQLGRYHGIDTVEVAPDDTLFVSIGDDAGNNGDPKTLRAQDLNQPYGKLLHLTADGRGVSGNPYYSATTPRSWRSMVYAYGFRNPFRFSLDPRSGIPHLGDVGWSTMEEVDAVRPGANAGWPCYEGKDRTTFSSYSVCQALYAAGSAQMPIWAYPHTVGTAVIGGVHYTGTSYPAQYRNAYFFGDYTRLKIWTLATDLQGHLTREPEAGGFATDVGAPVAFHAGPNGDVTYADLVTGKIRRLVYSPGNRAPVARFLSTTDAESRTVTFSAADSYDLDGDQVTYSWDLGDGSSGSGVTVSHTYDTPSPVAVTLTVRDQLGASDTATTTVYPSNHTPNLILETPSARTYAVGDTVSLSATANDTEDGNLTVSWDTAIRHCPLADSCHLHPDTVVTGATYSQPFTDHGSDTTMLITAHAEDSKGATTSVTYQAKPTLRTVAVNSPVAVSINGATVTSAKVVAGSAVELNTPLTTSYWRFIGWSDGGAASHAFTMPDRDLTLDARYLTAIDAKYAQLGGVSSLLGRPTTAEYDTTGGRARNYVGGRLYWSFSTGAHEVHGPILTKYLSGGGPAALFGFPTTDEIAVTGGRASYFTQARIYWSSTTGTHFSHGVLLSKYLASGGPSGYGLPTTDDTRISGGWKADFTGNRSIYSSATTGTHLVYGSIRTLYLRGGGPAAFFGFPTTDEIAVTGGRASYFTQARIYWSSTTGTHFSHGVLLTKYLAAGGPSGYGLPTTDDTKITGGWKASFSGGRSIYWSSTTGTHLVYGAILRKYASLGYQTSCLGFPTTDEYSITGGRRNRFLSGSITYLYGLRTTTAKC
ncbi:PQQ-dependent sugar dehydrogenase [Pedococcus sp. 5OH_020]|uniref:PQQ-dependent sugar dehydrogenase n=1 Tax=Pedococcus sp. 5OH_020 TaxID=2989814 RepID=UPI0022E9B547|nr:PQQ-dependent sugar dehydrogenase [Pedococcus sp. 5OH_020]